MKKSYKKSERRGLPGGPNEMFTYVTGVFSTEGYKKDSPDVNNPFNIIDSGSITMEDVEFPVMGIDNLGNSQMMMPGAEYQFPGDMVFELPMAQRGFNFDFSADGVKNFRENYQKLLTGAAQTVFGPPADQINRGKRLLSSYSPGMVLNYKNYEDGDYLPVFNKAKNKDDAFEQARADLGPGKRFIYDGVRYTTDYYGETEDEQTNIALDRIKNYLKDKPGAYDRFIEQWNKSGQPNFRGKAPDTPLFDLSKYGAQGPSLQEITEGRPFFNSFAPTNTIYFGEDFDDLSDLEVFEFAVKEIPHGQQWKDEGTFSFNTKIGKQILENLPKDKPLAELTEADFNRAQSKTYYTEGHLEHEAHKIMEEDITDYILGKKERGGGLTRQLRNFEYDKKRNKRFAQEGGEKVIDITLDQIKEKLFQTAENFGNPGFYNDKDINKAQIVRMPTEDNPYVIFNFGEGGNYEYPVDWFRTSRVKTKPVSSLDSSGIMPMNVLDSIEASQINVPRIPTSYEAIISADENMANPSPSWMSKEMKIEGDEKRMQELLEMFGNSRSRDIQINPIYKQEGGGVNEEGVKQYTFLKEYMNSPMYAERLKIEFPDYSDEQIAEEAKTRLQNVMQTRVGFLPESSKYSESIGDVQGFVDPENFPDMMMLRPEYSALTPDNPPYAYNTTPIHEWQHVADEVGNRMPQSTKDLISSFTKDNVLDMPKEDYYYTKPTEIVARIQELRYLLDDQGIYDAKKDKFTQEDLDKAKKNDRIKYNARFQDLMDNIKSDEALIELMNSIAAIDTMEQDDTMMAQGGIEIPKRIGTRKNADGRESTHLMKAEQLEDGNWVAFPSLFQNEDGKWIDMSGEKDWMKIYNEALKRGEVINFGDDKETAIKFGEGSWKSKMAKGGSVSWQWKGKTYSGTLIPSMENEKNRYARTKNGKIKTLPKAQRGMIVKLAKLLKNIEFDDLLPKPSEKMIDMTKDTPKSLPRPRKEDYTFYRYAEDDSGILDPLDFGNTKTILNEQAPENLTFFAPNTWAFDGYQGAKGSLFGANIIPKKPYMPYKGQVWDSKTIQKLIDEGYDAILPMYGKGDDIRDAHEIIPLDKNIITNLKKIKQAGGDIDLSGEEQKDFLKEWLYSPMGQQMLSNSFKGNQRLIDDRTFKRDTFLDDVDIETGVGDFSGRYNRGPHRIQMNENYLDRFGYLLGKEPKDVLLHELSHAQDFGGKYGGMNKLNMPLSDVKFIESLTKSSIKDKKNYDLSRDEIKDLRYYGSPTEVRARLNALRYFYETDAAGGKNEKGLPSIFNSPVTPEMQESMKINDQYRDLKKVYTDDEILQLLNTISYQESDFNKEADKFIYARYGSELPKAQYGALRNLIKKGGPKIMKYIDNLLGRTDDVVKAAPEVSKQKGMYKMLPIKKLEYPTHYGDVTFADGTIQNALDMLKAQGKYADDVGFQIKDLVGENIQYLGNQGGRTIVNVPLPDGKSQLFYKSTDLAGKGTEGVWQPYAGHATVKRPGGDKIQNWFIKDEGFENFYDSQSFRDIAGNLDRIAAEQGWDMSEQILKSKMKDGGDLPKAQRGLINKLIKKGATYADDILKRFSDGASKFDDIMKLPDDEFKTITGSSKDYWKLIADKRPEYKQRLINAYDNMWQPSDKILNMVDKTKNELSAFYKSPQYKQRLIDGMKISSKEADTMIDDLIKEMDNATLRFNNSPLPMDGVGLASSGSPTGSVTFTDKMLDMSDEQIADLIRHEFAHVGTYGRGPAGKILNSLDTPKVQKSTAQIWNQSDRGKQLFNYHNNPDEVRQRAINALSYMQKNKLSVDEFMDIPYDRIVNNVRSGKMSQDLLDLRQFFDPKDMKNYLNKAFSIAAPIGIGSTMLPDKQVGGEEGEFQLPFTKEDWEYYRSKFKPAPFPPPGMIPTPEPTMAAQSPSGITPELLFSQAFVESKLDPSIKNDKGYMGLGQIGKGVIEDYKKANKVSELDPFNPQDNYNVQNWYMNKIYNSEWIDKPNQSDDVRVAKTLAAYSLGPTKAKRFFTKFKEDGKDIYNSFDWLDDLPDETTKYIKMILKGENTQKRPRVQEYIQDALTNDKYKSIRDLYFKRLGGENKILNTYVDYINGNVSDERSEKVYNKLNRIHLKDAKEKGMSVPNYIMTYLAGNS